ncbi:MAG: DUF2183 domain-containing protein [Bdellovibrionales bacterium]|nr:DUF2183 domain-containing protein [Bdellovibrionales bacterium]
MKSRLRLTDFPQNRWFGLGIRLWKTLEVPLFKLLQLFGVYTPQKSIVGIPSLATRNFTMVQAVVYNGTQEEVLGYRPRRLLHRILKGLPDVELYERIRFQVALGEHNTRTVEESTETRGFIQVQFPSQLPMNAPSRAYLRMEPCGIETFAGLIRLGNYEVLSAPVFLLNNKIEWVIVSDIDDTIKDSKIAETTTLRSVVTGLFRGHYYTYTPIKGMAQLYTDLVAHRSLVLYLTSTPYQLAPFLLKFLKECDFPKGPVFLRWLGYGRVRHKWRTLLRVLSNLEPNQRCILIGDSGEQDLHIYRRICENPTFGKRVERILIRHVPGTPVQTPKSEKEFFYNEIAELREHLSFVTQT